MKGFFRTSDDAALTMLRLAAGGVIFAHGLQKMFGLFGGHGVQTTVQSFQQWFSLPPLVTMLVILSDSIGAFMIIVGFATRFAAFASTLVMLGAIVLVHGRWGFYMNWYAQPRGEGFEFHLLVIAILAVLMWRGGGKASVDLALSRRMRGAAGPQG